MKKIYWLLTVCCIMIGTLVMPEAVYGTEAVQETIQGSSLNTTEVTLQVGKTKKLKLKNAKGKIKWSTSKASIARVSKKGVVTATGRGKATITAKAGKKKYKCQVFCYQVDYYNAKVAKKAAKIIKNNVKASMSQAEMVKVIHDYMVLNCAYDYSNYLKGTIPWDSYSPVGCLLKKKAVCQGYAETFQLFMESMGFPCHVVRGTANGGGHAWNCVRVDKKWYQIDVTWDDPVPDRPGKTRYAYFLIPDSKMDDDHVWTKSNYPRSKTNSDKFIYLFGDVSNTKEEAMQSLYEQYITGAGTLNLVYTKENWDSLEIKIPYWDMIEEYDIEQGGHHMGYSYSYYQYGKYMIVEVYVGR